MGGGLRESEVTFHEFAFTDPRRRHTWQPASLSLSLSPCFRLTLAIPIPLMFAISISLSLSPFVVFNVKRAVYDSKAR